jgi:hypothetical protein
MPDPSLILGAVAAAAAVAAVMMLFGVWPARSSAVSPTSTPTSGSALTTLLEVLAVGWGTWVGCWWLGLLPKWPPIEDQDRLLMVLLPAAGVVEILAALLKRRPWFGRVFRVLLALPTPALLLLGSGYLPGSDPTAPATWTKGEAIAILLGLGVLLAVVWSLLIAAARRPGGFAVPAALGLIVAATGVCMLLSGYASGGLVGLPFAGVAGGALAVCLLLARSHAMTGVVGIGTVFLFGLLMAGRFFGELTDTNFALLIVAPLLCWIVAIPSVRRWKAPAGVVAAILICLLPAGVALGLAYRDYAAATGEASEYSAAAGSSTESDAPAFNAQPPGGPANNSTELSPPPSTSSPRDPSADEAPRGAPTRSPAPLDPGEDSKK